MKELLLADAHQLSASLSEYEIIRQQIERAEYKTFSATLKEKTNSQNMNHTFHKETALSFDTTA